MNFVGCENRAELILLSVVFLIRGKVSWAPRQCICFAVILSLSIRDLEMVICEEFGLSGLSSCKLLGGHEIFEIFVISKYLDRQFGSFEFRSPFFKISYDS
jgi:hypothetical protein